MSDPLDLLRLAPPLAVSLGLTLSGALPGDATPAAGQAEQPVPTPVSATNPPLPAAEPAPVAPTPSVPSPDPEKARAEKELALRRRFLPEPLSATELAALSETLGMSEASRSAFVDVCARYAAMSELARGDAGRQLLRTLPASFRYNPHETEFEPVHTPVLLTMYSVHEEVGKRVRDAEELLARELRNLADSGRQIELRLALTGRAEQVYGHPARLPGARVNLLDLLPKAGLSREDLGRLTVALDRYAGEYVSLLKERDGDLRSVEVRRAQAHVGLGPEWRAGRTIAEGRKVERELAALDMAEVRSDIPLRDLNSATLDRIRKSLSPAQSRRVAVAWQSIVHPELFEEDRLSRIVMERFLGTDNVPAEARSAAIDRFLQLEDQLWPLGQQVVELADNVVVAERLPPTDAAEVRIALDAQVQKIQMRRRNVVRESVRELLRQAPAEGAELRHTLEDTLLTLEAQDRASQFIIDQLALRQSELQAILAMGETPATATQDAPQPGEPAEAETVPVGLPSGSGSGTSDGSADRVPPPPGAPNANPEANRTEGQGSASPTPPQRPARESRGSRRGR